MSLSGSKSKSNQTTNQTQTNTLSDRAVQQLQASQARIGGMQYQGFDPSQLDQFQNPYQQDVIDASLADINRQQQLSLQQGGDSAQAAGAFGGSRHGVADALTREGYDRNASATVAGLRQSGYNTALQAALGENRNRNSYQMGIEQLLASLAGQYGREGTTVSNGTSKGTNSGFGFSWAPKIPGMG